MDRRELLNDERTAIQLMIDGTLNSIWTAVPAIIQSVDLTKMTVNCQPTIKVKTQLPDQSYVYVNLPLLLDVPVVFPNGGGFILTFPLAIGDEVLVVFSNQCIDAWWESGELSIPAEARSFDLSDGMAS